MNGKRWRQQLQIIQRTWQQKQNHSAFKQCLSKMVETVLKAEKKDLMEREKLEILGRKDIVLGGNSCREGRGRYQSQERISILGWRQKDRVLK